MSRFMKNFLRCGSVGWCLECFWTGLGGMIGHKDKTLPCRTSVWMFPIYGIAAIIEPLSNKMKNLPTVIRGSVYTVLIFTTEFLTGSLLKKHHSCPWDYSKAKLNYKGLIRLDYAPAWFISGLIFEHVVKQ